MNALEWAPAYNSGQGIPGVKMEQVNRGPAVPRRLRSSKKRIVTVDKKKRVPVSKMRPKYIAHPQPPIRTDEGAR